MAGSSANRAHSGLEKNENGSRYGGKGRVVSSSDIQETSPDLLKNTASNIAKLEDVIEHCKGRQKYLAQTRSPSDGVDVRWYFGNVPLGEKELAASIPQTEIVDKGEYFRFGMRDSLAIEAFFLQREEELLSNWWREYAECSEGPKDRSGSSKTSNKEFKESSSVSKLETLYEIEEERVGVPVKGGLYEVDLVKRHCFPVYWNGENRRVLRGHWFALKGGLDWRPLREDVAEQLEIAYRNQIWHRRTFQPSGLFAARVDLQSSTLGLHALFTGEDDTWEAWLNVDASGFSTFLGIGGKGIRLRRGYAASHSPKPTQDELRQQKEEEMDDYCSKMMWYITKARFGKLTKDCFREVHIFFYIPRSYGFKVPVRHLVFMVHGIGQRLEKSNLVDDVGNHRHITSSLAERHLTPHQLGMQRVLFIPCQWRKGLKLSGESAVEKCTLDGVRGLRVMLGATVHDVLYYMSPIYCQDIINSVSNQLNRLYLKFLRRNPEYDGKVSVYGHSLGSVLSYDILCHQENLSSPFPMDWMYNEKLKTKELSTDTKNQSSTSESLSKWDTVNPDAKNTSSACKIEEIIHTIDNESISGYKTFASNKEENLENSSVVVDSVTTNFDENTSGAINGKESFGRMAEQEHSNGNVKDELIKCLREEVDQLKKKVAVFEKQTTDTRRRKEVGKDGMVGSKEPTSRNPAPQPKSYTPYINYTKLEFKVDTFFAVGSPLGVFLALRNIRIGIGKGKEYWDEENISEEIPACRQMFNIFHPFDPVAYRIEPLICKEYLNIRPVIIPYHKGGRRLHIGFQEFTEDLAVRSHTLMNHLHTVRVKVLTICQSKKEDMDGDEDENSDDKEELSYGALMMKRLSGSEGGRVDHMLQDKTFEPPYLQAIGSHTNYWRDYDTALFILKHLYRDIPKDASAISYESKDGSDSTGWRDQREVVAEEELPLTFSDRNAAQNFTSKAKKIIKH